MVASDDILDSIISQIGGIGKQQIIILTCLFVVMLLHSATHIAYVFTSMDSDYRCLIPECDDILHENPDWLKNAVPFTSSPTNKPEQCLMYEYTQNSSKITNESCHFSSFNKSAVTRCNSYYFYDDDHYLGREFNLLCYENLWILSLVGTMNTIGMFLGLIVTGFISDRYGRKCVLLFGMSVCGVVGLIKTLSPSIVWYLAFELIEAIFSAGTCGCVFIIAIEMVAPDKRAMMGCILNTSYGLGEVLIAVIAWSTRNWRWLIYYTYGPSALICLLYWVLPESSRWTLSKGRIEETKQVLRNIATVNKKTLSENSLRRLEDLSRYSDCKSGKFIEIMKSKRLCWRFINCCFGWMTCAFLFYGITLSSVTLYGNKYLDFILISLIEFPAYFSLYYIIDKVGRRASLCGSYFIIFVASICFMFSTNSSTWFHLLTYCMGKFGATAAFNGIYVITTEIFPTPLRHTVMGLCSTIGRLGSVTSPQVSLLGRFWTPLPMIMFGIMSLAAGLVSFFLPESKGIKLPETVEEAENIK